MHWMLIVNIMLIYNIKHNDIKTINIYDQL